MDRRSGRDKVKWSEKEYLRLYNSIQDQNFQKKKKALKSKEKKIYDCSAQNLRETN